MIVHETQDGVYRVDVGQYVPALVLVFEAEAGSVHWFGPKDNESLTRICAGLTDEWAELLLRAIGDREEV